MTLSEQLEPVPRRDSQRTYLAASHRQTEDVVERLRAQEKGLPRGLVRARGLP